MGFPVIHRILISIRTLKNKGCRRPEELSYPSQEINIVCATKLHSRGWPVAVLEAFCLQKKLSAGSGSIPNVVLCERGRSSNNMIRVDMNNICPFLYSSDVMLKTASFCTVQNMLHRCLIYAIIYFVINNYKNTRE